MQRILHVLIAAGVVLFVLGGLLFVFGQTVFLIIGQPELVIGTEATLSAVIFPAIAVMGVLCYLYSAIYLRKKNGDESADEDDD